MQKEEKNCPFQTNRGIKDNLYSIDLLSVKVKNLNSLPFRVYRYCIHKNVAAKLKESAKIQGNSVQTLFAYFFWIIFVY